MPDGWPVSTPLEQRLNPDLVCGIGAKLENLKDANPNGVVIARNGAIVYERYFTGPDLRWPQQQWLQPPKIMPHDIHTKHDIQSTTLFVID